MVLSIVLYSIAKMLRHTSIKNIFLLVKPFRLGKYNNSKMQDQRAKEDLTLNRVERDVLRRLQIFTKSERAREQLERIAKEHADEWAEKKRL